MRGTQIRTCRRCVSDTTIPSIRFDEQGVCCFCHAHDRLAALYGDAGKTGQTLAAAVEKIKASGRGRKHDCIVGVSGGTDSSYVLHLSKQLGLRPLAVHFDNGWNTNESVTNIRAMTEKLGIELCTYVVDWEEFKDLQLSFLDASVPCVETPTDVAIHAVLYKFAREEGLRYILGGQSFKTEGTVPREWSYLDGTYIKAVHRRFGKRKLRSYPNATLSRIFADTFIHGVRQLPILNYVDYRKKTAKELLSREYGWQDYPGHHYENLYSRFAFGWYLPRKFGIDKRIVSLSGPVRSGHITREEALEELGEKPAVDQKLVDYVAHKLELTPAGFDRILAAPNKTYRDYFTSESILKHFKGPMRLAVRMNVFTPVLYEKYFA